MNKILFLFTGADNSLRLVKIATFLKQNGYSVSFIGWPRTKEKNNDPSLFEKSEAVIRGGGEANSKLPILYIIFIFKLFFKLLFRKGLNDKLIFCVNFETGFVTWLISYFRKITYCYDIWDELALSHNFPCLIVKILRYFDRKIRARSAFYIHVDESRLSSVDDDLSNSIIIYNSPVDYYNNKFELHEHNDSFAITGWLNKTRGLNSLFEFAYNHPEYKFIVAGSFLQKEIGEKFHTLPNVEIHEFMPQSKLFDLISKCRGIFSLYDPSIPINRLAASNKLYDAMMLGIPVIVNNGLIAANVVNQHKVGFVVNYLYDQTWLTLIESDENIISEMGLNGRQLYLQKYEFNEMCKKVLLPKVDETFQHINNK